MKGLAKPDAEIAAAQYPKIGIFRTEHRPSDYPRWEVEAKSWVPCTPENVAETSAVAYYFARDIHQKENVPIGLIETFWGGSAAESWTSPARALCGCIIDAGFCGAIENGRGTGHSPAAEVSGGA